MKVRTLRRKLDALIRGEKPPLNDADLLALKALLATLELNDSKSVEEVCEQMGLDIASWFRPRRQPKAVQPDIAARPPIPDASLSARIRDASGDDQRFTKLISDLRQDRLVTKAMLSAAYVDLFGERVSPSRTKAAILQDISDERLVRARHDKAVRALAGTAAE